MMAAVNWFCLVLAFALIKIYVCIKVDPSGIPSGKPSGNYTTTSLNSYTIQPYAKSTIMSNEADNFTLLGNTELSASERTRRLIPYMAFYVPVSELPINKQYVSKHNIHATKQLATRPTATGGGAGPTGNHIPIPSQYVHDGVQYLPSVPSTGGQQHYQPNAGLSIYHTHGYGGQHPQQQQKFHLLPSTTGHSQHLQAPGPPGPSAADLPSLVGHGNNAFVPYKEVKPIRQKTVQYFPPLSSTPSSASPSSSASSAFETIRQASSFAKQQHKIHNHGVSGSSGNSNNPAIADAVGYRSRTKQSKINLTPFTPSNTVPGSFVPIVYTPLNNNNNNIVNSHNAGGEYIDDSSFNQEGNQYYHKQQQQQPQQLQQQPQQIALEYSSGPLPPSGSAASISIDVPQHYHHNQQQQQLHNPKQQPQYYSVTTSPVVNFDAGGGAIASGNSVNSAHHQHHNAQAIRLSKPQYIDYIIDEPKQSLDNKQQQQQQQQQHNTQQQLELLKPTLGPPSHPYILETTPAPFQPEPVTEENYDSSLRPSYKSRPKLRLQPVVHEKNVNYPTIREQNPAPKRYNEDNEKPKYVYIKEEEFGQKLKTVSGDGAVKLKPLNNNESDGSDDSHIPQQHHHQQQQHYDDLRLQPLAPKLSTTQHNHQNEVPANVLATPPKTILADPNELPDIRTSSLAEILHKLQESNHLPHTLTPDNIDNSIKTLIRILNNLKQTQTIVANPPQHHEIPAHSHPSSSDYDYTTDSEEDHQQQQPHDLSLPAPTGPNKHPGPSTGRPGIDYPNYADIPQTAFDCSQQRYKGFFGDPETNCQVWHYCDLNGGKASFLCPNGTIFSQIALTCDWWFNVKCATTAQLYVLNERLYKYILPFTPKFPEDYSGPIVDKYLAMKFQEMEEKLRVDKEKALQEEEAEAVTETEQPIETVSEDSKEDNHLEETTTVENDAARHVKSHPPAKHHKLESVNSQVSEQSPERNLLIDDEVNDISQRGTANNFESTTIATIAATKKPDPPLSFSLKPIIVSSTLGPDYDDDHLQSHENEKRSNENPTDDAVTQKNETDALVGDDNKNSSGVETAKSITSAATTSSPNNMQITVEKVDVIEIKPDGATGHLIRDMLLNSKHTNE